MRDDEKLVLQPPEPEYISASYSLRVPVTDKHLGNKWELRKYAAQLLKDKIGDDAQITHVNVHPPGLLARLAAQLLRRLPRYTLDVTVKF